MYPSILFEYEQKLLVPLLFMQEIKKITKHFYSTSEVDISKKNLDAVTGKLQNFCGILMPYILGGEFASILVQLLCMCPFSVQIFLWDVFGSGHHVQNQIPK